VTWEVEEYWGSTGFAEGGGVEGSLGTVGKTTSVGGVVSIVSSGVRIEDGLRVIRAFNFA